MPEETATKLIPDLDVERTRRAGNNAFAIRKREWKDWKPFEKFKGSDVYLSGSDSSGYYFLVENDKVVYFVKYSQIKGSRLTFGRQVLVWREDTSLAAAGFAKHIFWEKLLPRFKALITDTQQTTNGRGFWSYVLSEAFSKGTRVYFYDRSAGPIRLIELFSPEDLNKYKDEIWGTSNRHLQTHAVISSVELKLKAK